MSEHFYAYPPAAATPKPTSGLAVASLICGVFGFLSCGLTAPIALVLGIVAMTQTANGTRAGHGQAWAGVILGGIIIAIWLLMVIFGFWGTLLEGVQS